MDLSRMFESIYKSYNFQTANLNKKNTGRKFTGEKKQTRTNDSYGRKKKEKKGKRTIHATGDQNENSKRE